MKPKGILVIHEPVENSQQTDFSSQVAKVKLGGFLLKNQEPTLFTLNDKSVCEIVAEKPPYEVSYVLRQ